MSSPGEMPSSFAYPFGGFGADTPELVKSAGFERACSTQKRRRLGQRRCDAATSCSGARLRRLEGSPRVCDFAGCRDSKGPRTSLR